MLWPAVVSTTRSLSQRRYRTFLIQGIVGIIIISCVLNFYGPSVRDFVAIPLDQDAGPLSSYTRESLLTPKPDAEVSLEGFDDEPETDLEEGFLQEFSRQEITGNDDGSGLATLCSQGSRPWNPHVIIECPILDGGFGNVRLNLLQCLRFVIEAKVSMKLPRIARRSAKDVTDFRTNDYVGLDYLIDETRFLKTLGKHCPSLVVRPADYADDRVRRLRSISPVIDLELETYNEEGMPDTFAVPTKPQQWPPALDEWLASETEDEPPSAESPVVFGLETIMFNWPTRHDPPSVVRHFSELVRPRDEVKLLAAAALQRMQQQYNAHVGFRTREEPRVRDNAFLGVHLRVEKDASDFHWISYEDQLHYLAQRLLGRIGKPTHPAADDNDDDDDAALPDTEKAVLYVACGDADGVARLAGDLAPMTVVTKNELLPEGTFAGAALRNMTWDQQALVDMLILEHAGYFIGVRDSTFSWHLALRRAAAVNWVVGGYPAECWLYDEDGKERGRGRRRRRRRKGCRSMLADNEEWRDNLSALVGNEHGRVEPQLENVIWP